MISQAARSHEVQSHPINAFERKIEDSCHVYISVIDYRQSDITEAYWQIKCQLTLSLEDRIDDCINHCFGQITLVTL